MNASEPGRTGSQGGGARSLRHLAWQRLRHNRTAMLGFVLTTFVVAVSLLGPWLAPFDPQRIFEVPGTRPPHLPSAEHWLGTDALGRDILSRILCGGRYTLGVSLLTVLLATLLGTPIGISCGYFQGRFDNLVMRAMDIILSFPSLLLALAIIAALGKGLVNAMLAIAIVYIPKFARIVRAAALKEEAQDYVAAAEALGCGRWRIMALHILPNCLPPLIVVATLSLATAILEIAALSFLGLGIQPPMPEWGAMLNEGRRFYLTHPHIMLPPGLAIVISVLGINLLGDGLRDALDPRLQAA